MLASARKRRYSDGACVDVSAANSSRTVATSTRLGISDSQDSLASKILTDFRGDLKASGMIERQIKGANGSLYTANSDAAHRALEQLWNVLMG